MKLSKTKKDSLSESLGPIKQRRVRGSPPLRIPLLSWGPLLGYPLPLAQFRLSSFFLSFTTLVLNLPS